MKEKKIVQVAMPPELYEAVKRLAEQEARTVPGQIRQLLYRSLELSPVPAAGRVPFSAMRKGPKNRARGRPGRSTPALRSG